MNVLMLLTKLFRNDPRVYYEAQALVEQGHDVSVLVWAHHDTLGKLPEKEVVDGIHIYYIHGGKKNPILGELWWWRKARRKALKLHAEKTLHVVHCHDLDTLPIGVKLKKKLGVKLVYDSHEIFHWMIMKDNPGVIVAGAKLLEKMLISKSDHIITTCEPFRRYLKSITTRPISLVMNCKPIISQSYSLPSNPVPVFTYIGILHQSRMFPEIVDVLGSISNLKFVIAGKKENLYEEVKKRSAKYSNVVFLGSICYDEVLKRTLEADVVLCPIDPSDKNNSHALANKQFEAMVCGRPILVSEETYAGEVTQQHGIGMVVEHSPNAFRDAVIALRDDPEKREKLGRKALETALERFNWQQERRKLVDIYSKL